MLDIAKLSVIVLGGGDPKDALAEINVSPTKSLIPIHGLPMANYVLRALRKAGLRNILYVGKATPPLEPLIDVVLADTGSMVGNLRAAQQTLLKNETTGYVLVVTADVPLLGVEAITDFLQNSPKADFVYPIISKNIMDAQFPAGKRTYAALKDGKFTGGNIVLLRLESMPNMMNKLEDAFSKRKNPLALASMIGPSIAVQFALGRLQISQLEMAVSRILGVQAVAYISPHPSIGFDVDKPEDLELVRQLIKSNPEP